MMLQQNPFWLGSADHTSSAKPELFAPSRNTRKEQGQHAGTKDLTDLGLESFDQDLCLSNKRLCQAADTGHTFLKPSC